MPDEVARFDALGAGRSFVFEGLRGVLVARTLEEVVPVLRAVEEAVVSGLHAAGFVAYEAAPAFDPALATRPPDPRLPLARFALFAERRPAELPEGAAGAVGLGEWTAALSAAGYAERVERIRALIAAGDTYQVNLTFPLRAPFRGDDRALYLRLARAQRSAYCAFLRFGDTSVVSASPELFFRQAGRELEMRPMKGTRPRGRWAEEDDALAAELAGSEKDRAENLMIVDLLRNDAGRVSRFGSVRVERLFEVERYETVHQMTSTVRSRLREDAGVVDLFRALFPCGSVTGAPKVRTSQVIAELEDGPRGVYCGALGFVSPGEAVFSVAIRTVVVHRDTGEAELGVGSGITYDSDAAAEHAECLSKAEFARRAAEDFRLLETMLREADGGWLLLDGHLRRMAASARRFGFAFDAEGTRARLDGEVRGLDGHLRVRLLLDRAGKVEVQAAPLDDGPAEPLRVAVCADPVDERDPLLYHKTTSRGVYTARAAARPEVDDVLLVNGRGELTESTVANLVVQLHGERWTPPVACGLLPGVFRAELLRSGEVRERVLLPGELERAEAVWLVSSVRRWRRAVIVD